MSFSFSIFEQIKTMLFEAKVQLKCNLIYDIRLKFNYSNDEKAEGYEFVVYAVHSKVRRYKW